MGNQPLKCPEGGARMVLRQGKYSNFWGCINFPRCKGSHGAHPDGKPLGIPADKETKQWRIKAHDVFNRLFKGPTSRMTRKEAYRELQRVMNMSASDAHIGRFNIEQCKLVISVFS